MNKQEILKIEAAKKAVEFIKSGMIIGLGTGSTANYAINMIGEKLKSGMLTNIKGIPSSSASEKLARELNIPITTFKVNPIIDVTLDGADEVDNDWNIIKGGGGALLREKILAQASKNEIIMIDELKLSPKIGTKWVIPIEVIPFALYSEKLFLEKLGAIVNIRERNNSIFITDEENYILDCNFGIIEKPQELSEKLNSRAGIVEHGMFINLCDTLITATEEGVKVSVK